MERSRKSTFTVSLLVMGLMLVADSGCNSSADSSNSTAPATEPASQAATASSTAARDPRMIELVTGHLIFDKLLSTARLWSSDAMPVTLQSQLRKENTTDGRSCVWALLVASKSKNQIKVFDWSGIVSADAHAPGIHNSPAN